MEQKLNMAFEKERERPIAHLVALVIGMALATLMAMWQALFLKALWSWHIVPLGAPSLTTSSAVGLILTFMVLRGGSKAYDDHEIDLARTWASEFLMGPFCVAISYAASWWLN